MALRNKRGTEGRAYRAQRANPSSEFARVYGARLHELMRAAQDISKKPLSGTSPEQARDVRARAWNYVFQCWQEKQKAAGVSSTNGGDDAERDLSDSARTIIPDR